jgi:hypothetical protein
MTELAPLDLLFKRHRTRMGFTVELLEQEDGSFVIRRGGIEVKRYATLPSAIKRHKREVADVEGWESQLIEQGKWHPVQLCAGGCGLEMRDGRIDQSQPKGRIRCVSCGPFPLQGEES